MQGHEQPIRQEQEAVLTAWREAIFEEFGDWFRANLDRDAERVRAHIERHTFPGADDPGQWFPTAAGIIHLEFGFPGTYEVEDLNGWLRVSERMQATGHPYYVDFVNRAVAALCPC
jgi:hypothetical protein